MANNTSALRITELDFDTVKNNLKTFLRGQTIFQDYDFDGAGMNVLLDILAYNTHYMGFYLNMTGNEMFLDTAQIRGSVLSLAKMIGYVPASNEGALSRVNILATPGPTENQSINNITIDKYTPLIGSDINGVNFPFVTLNSVSATKSGGAFNFANVSIKQGQVITRQYTMTPDNTSRRFEIPSANVDTSTISITVQASSTNTQTTVYTLASDITEIDANSAIYFIEENDNLNYTFTFGDNILGTQPKFGSVINVTYLDNVGSISNNITKFVFTQPIGGLFRNNVSITSAISSYGGTDKEGIESVRYRAPYFYSTQNRAVTKNDYETLLLKDYNFIDSASVWGGEDNDPPIYGKVFISIKTKGYFQLTNFEKQNLINDLIAKRNVLTVTPEIIDPDYLFVGVVGTVTYDSSATNATFNDLLSLVQAAITDYNTLEIGKFKSTFRKSRLGNYIDTCDPSITGSNIDVLLQKRITLDTNNTRSYDVNFNVPIRRTDLSKKLKTFPELQIYDANSILRNCFIEEVPSSASGISGFTIPNSGQNYAIAPKVVISGDGTGAAAYAVVSGGKLTSVVVTNPGTNYSYAVIQFITDPTDIGTGAVALPILEKDVGQLQTIYYKTTGEKVVLNPFVGTIDYVNGKIHLNSLKVANVMANDYYSPNVLTFTVYSNADTISPLRNRIVTIDQNDPSAVSIAMTAESGT